MKCHKEKLKIRKNVALRSEGRIISIKLVYSTVHLANALSAGTLQPNKIIKNEANTFQKNSALMNVHLIPIEEKIKYNRNNISLSIEIS